MLHVWKSQNAQSSAASGKPVLNANTFKTGTWGGELEHGSHFLLHYVDGQVLHGVNLGKGCQCGTLSSVPLGSPGSCIHVSVTSKSFTDHVTPSWEPCSSFLTDKMLPWHFVADKVSKSASPWGTSALKWCSHGKTSAGVYILRLRSSTLDTLGIFYLFILSWICT